MFTLSDCYRYDSTLDEIVAKAVEISEQDADLTHNAVRYGIAHYENLHNHRIKQSISEMCRGCDLLIGCDKARVRTKPLLYKIGKWCVTWYAKINNALPLMGTYLASWMLDYLSPVIVISTGVDGNQRYDKVCSILTSLPYFLVLIAQSYLMLSLTNWYISAVYAFTAPVSGIFALRFRYSDDDLQDLDAEGWRERLRTEEIKEVIEFSLDQRHC